MAGQGGFLLPVGTVTMLLADVEGSSRRWEQDEEAMAATIAGHGELVGEAIGRHHGVRPLEQGEGDSFVAAFARPSDAVACAMEIARAGLLPTRMAVHTGEAHRTEEGTYVGPTLNRAGRLRDAAHGGQIVLSHAAAELVADRLPKEASLRDLGQHRLKDLERPERIFQLLHPDLRAGFPPLRTLDTYRHNLPQQRTPLIGRSTEIVEVAGLLERSRLVTVTGPGGCGKTRLSVAIAAGLLDHHPGGAFFVDLSPLPPEADPATLKRAIGRGLSLTDDAADDPLPFLREKRLLLVLDNCEHVVTAAAHTVDELLDQTEELRVLATSREPLAVAGETTFLLPSLEVPPKDDSEGILGLSAYAATELFLDRVVRAQGAFTPTAEDAEAIADVCRRLDGIPLAIELAAARVRVLSPRQIADALDERFDLLTGGPRTALARQQTLRASVDWSHALLTEPERMVLRRLAVFPGEFDLAAAAAAAARPPVEGHQVLDLLSLLVDKSLVEVVGGGGDGGDRRYRLLDTIRTYARERLKDADEENTVRERHRDHHLALVERLEPELWAAGGVAAYHALAAVAADVEAALRWSLDRSDVDEALRFVAAYAETLNVRWVGAPLPWFGAVLPRLAEGGPAAQLSLLYAYACHVLRVQQTPDDALGAVAAGALSAAAASIPARLARRGVLAAAVLGGLPKEEVADRCAEIRDAASAAGDLETATIAEVTRWRSTASTPDMGPCDTLDRVIGLAEQGGPLLQAAVLSSYAGYAHDATRALTAVERLERSGVGRVPSVHRHAVRNAAFALAALGRHREAADVARSIHPGFVENGDTACASFMLLLISSEAEEEGRLEDALALCEEAIESFRPTPLWAGFSPLLLARLAALHVSRGDAVAARRACAAFADATTAGSPFQPSSAATAGALVAIAAGDAHRAEVLALDAVELAVGPAGPPTLAAALQLLAVAASHLGRDSRRAVRLLAAGDALGREVGSGAPWLALRRLHEEAVEGLRTQLGPSGFDDAWREGAAMGPNGAVAYARRGRGERRRPPAGWESLTPAEEQVVALVAEGLSNGAIAERLFISVRTVTTHLTHVYAKLALSTRGQLAVAAVLRRDSEG